MGIFGKSKHPKLKRANVYGNKQADEMWELNDGTPISRALSRKNNPNSQTNAISKVIRKGKEKGFKKVRVGKRLFNIDSEDD